MFFQRWLKQRGNLGILARDPNHPKPESEEETSRTLKENLLKMKKKDMT